MMILTLILIEVMLTTAVTSLEKRMRMRVLTKWAKGEMTMRELLWLKKQPWFQKAFVKKHDVSPEKKDQ
jgi:hypothetical protein